MSRTLEELRDKLGQLPCHICDGTVYEWGYLETVYTPEWTSQFDGRRRILAARRCLSCHNVQVFADERINEKAKKIGRGYLSRLLGGG